MSIRINGKIVAGSYIPPQATNTTSGIIRIATDEEAKSGNLEDVAVTPKQLSQYGGGGFEIGDIGIALLGIDETQNKRRYINGQLIIQDQFVSFTNKVKKAVELYPSLACTEEQWQATVIMSAFGQCGKFVIDDEVGTIRLPKITGFIQGLTDLASLGELVEAGLPNITGTFTGRGHTSGNTAYGGSLQDSQVTGAFDFQIQGGSSSGSGAAEGDNGIKFDLMSFDASRSSSIYGNNDTVQPESVRYPYFIQVATGAEESVDVIREAQLNIPFFFGTNKYFATTPNNASWLKSDGQFYEKIIYTDYYDWLLRIYNGVETVEGVNVKYYTDTDITNYDFVINDVNETFRLPLLNGEEDLPSEKHDVLELKNSGSSYTAPANGWFVVVGIASGSSAYVDLVGNVASSSYCQTSGHYLKSYIPVSRGSTCLLYYTDLSQISLRFVYAQGNGSLYFYVGEVNQDSHLINSGRVLEILPKKLDKAQLYNKMTNCITEIPQKIKYTLENGTLTIKAGSVVIVPYGTEDKTSQYPVGATFLNDNFKVYDTQFTDGKFFVWAELVGDVSYVSGTVTSSLDRFITIDITNKVIDTHIDSVSGASPVATSIYTVSYDTTTNLIGYSGNNTNLIYNVVHTLPFMMVNSVTNGYLVGSINQVFNGMGYIGSTVWVDKGIKGLIPNGRNEDGSLNNIEYTTEKLCMHSSLGGTEGITKFFLSIKNNKLSRAYKYYEQTATPVTDVNAICKWFNPDTNTHYYLWRNEGVNEWTPEQYLDLGNIKITDTNGVQTIDNFNPKQPFRAIDYSDKSWIAQQSFPSNRIVTLTAGASNTLYTAPANGYIQGGVKKTNASDVAYINVSIRKTATSETLLQQQGWIPYNASAGNTVRVFVPCQKGQIIYVGYYNATIDFLQFVYATGEQ